jgi:hypothetical protein
MAAKSSKKITLIASDSKNPIGNAKSGTKLQVVSVQLSGSAAAGGAKSARAARPMIGSRLCGGTSTCLAVFEV